MRNVLSLPAHCEGVLLPWLRRALPSPPCSGHNAAIAVVSPFFSGVST